MRPGQAAEMRKALLLRSRRRCSGHPSVEIRAFCLSPLVVRANHQNAVSGPVGFIYNLLDLVVFRC